ncbi:MAG: protein tyrosine phosphatase family protein [Gammaproteobacteria bacterium]|nr:protein tyrosine phosphatase family protein [Gammaproteobacteria bacterium]MDH5693638.1 protein tyrosine phosphatase family protein [Gammaproteobacteria bacterium]
MITDIIHFHLVDKRIATGGQPTASQIDELQRAGYDVLISMAKDDHFDNLVDEANLASTMTMEYVFIPVVMKEPLLDDFDKFSKTMEYFRDKKVFVHCNANKRTSVFVALWRILSDKADFDEAMSHVTEVWEPNDIWTSFIEDVLKHYRSK